MKAIKIIVLIVVLLMVMGAKPKKQVTSLQARVERLELSASRQGKRIVWLTREIEDLEGLCLKCCGPF